MLRPVSSPVASPATVSSILSSTNNSFSNSTSPSKNVPVSMFDGFSNASVFQSSLGSKMDSLSANTVERSTTDSSVCKRITDISSTYLEQPARVSSRFFSDSNSSSESDDSDADDHMSSRSEENFSSHVFEKDSKIDGQKNSEVMVEKYLIKLAEIHPKYTLLHESIDLCEELLSQIGKLSGTLKEQLARKACNVVLNQCEKVADEVDEKMDDKWGWEWNKNVDVEEMESLKPPKLIRYSSLNVLDRDTHKKTYTVLEESPWAGNFIKKCLTMMDQTYKKKRFVDLEHIEKPTATGGWHFCPEGNDDLKLLQNVQFNQQNGVFIGWFTNASKVKFSSFFPLRFKKIEDLIVLMQNADQIAKEENRFLFKENGTSLYFESYAKNSSFCFKSMFPIYYYLTYAEGTFYQLPNANVSSEKVLELATNLLTRYSGFSTENPVRYRVSKDGEKWVIIDLAPELKKKAAEKLNEEEKGATEINTCPSQGIFVEFPEAAFQPTLLENFEDSTELT